MMIHHLINILNWHLSFHLHKHRRTNFLKSKTCLIIFSLILKVSDFELNPKGQNRFVLIKN